MQAIVFQVRTGVTMIEYFSPVFIVRKLFYVGLILSEPEWKNTCGLSDLSPENVVASGSLFEGMNARCAVQ